jgi:hypothetical protein
MEKLDKRLKMRFPRRGGLDWPKDWVLKLVSLLFALTLWYFVVGEAKVDITLFVPLEIVNLPPNLVIANQFKKELEVTVNGPRGLTRNLMNQHFSRPVDMENAKPGTMVIQNGPDSINFPRGIRVVRIQPTNITIEIDRLRKAVLPVKPEMKGKPAAGFEITAATPEPRVIEVTAPSKILAPVQFLPTRGIDVKGIRTSKQVDTHLDLGPELAELIGDPLIKVTVTVREKMEPLEIKGVKVDPGASGGGKLAYSLAPRTVTVKVMVPYHLLHGKERQEPGKLVRAALVPPLPQIPGVYSVKPGITAEGGIRVAGVVPPELKLTVRRKNGPATIRVIRKRKK